MAAHEVKSRSGFSVIYGPIRACDITAFVKAGMKATEQMRQVRFSLYDRLALVPVEFVNGVKYLIFAIAVFFTPDSDVYVDAPVKFIVINDDIAAIKNIHPLVSSRPPVSFKSSKTAATVKPTEKPLNEKLLPGSHGSST